MPGEISKIFLLAVQKIVGRSSLGIFLGMTLPAVFIFGLLHYFLYIPVFYLIFCVACNAILIFLSFHTKYKSIANELIDRNLFVNSAEKEFLLSNSTILLSRYYPNPELLGKVRKLVVILMITFFICSLFYLHVWSVIAWGMVIAFLLYFVLRMGFYINDEDSNIYIVSLNAAMSSHKKISVDKDQKKMADFFVLPGHANIEPLYKEVLAKLDRYFISNSLFT